MKRALPYLVLLATFSITNIAYAASSATSSAIIGPNGIEVKATAEAGQAKSYSYSSVKNDQVTATANTNSVSPTHKPTITTKTSPKTLKETSTEIQKEPKTEKVTASQSVPAAVNQAMNDNQDEAVITEKTVKRFGGFMISILIFQVINTILLFSLLFKLYKPTQQRF